MTTVWLDGKLEPTAHVPLLGHAVQRGSLVFDVGSFHPTARGSALFRAPEHIARFLASMRIVGLEQPWGEAEILEAARAVVRASGMTEGLVRWSAFLKAAEPDLLPTSFAAHVAVAALPWTFGKMTPLAIAIFDDARKAAPEVLPPTTKAAGAYLGPMLARRRAVAAGADDVVLLDRDGFVAEAPVSNVFAVVDGALWTPPLTYVLPGITRASVLTLAREDGITIREEPLPRAVFESAAEAFMTSTGSLVAPIASVNGKRFAAPGPLTLRLAERLAAAQRGDVKTEWLCW